jgi:hypothetical protein
MVLTGAKALSPPGPRIGQFAPMLQIFNGILSRG